jgi:hypothetical protein
MPTDIDHPISTDQRYEKLKNQPSRFNCQGQCSCSLTNVRTSYDKQMYARFVLGKPLDFPIQKETVMKKDSYASSF